MGRGAESIQECPTNVQTRSQISLLSCKAFEYRGEGSICPGDHGRSQKGQKQIPEEVSSLLDRFKGLAPDELPTGLPPFCNIQHQIDFIPGVVHPHLPHYRSHLRQVDELT